MAQQRLELTWVNKDKALIPTEHGRYGYSWVDPRDPRYCEIRPLVLDEVVRGEQAPKDPARNYTDRAELAPQAENLLIHGESGDVLEALTRVPELAEQYVGQVKCIYIDPPFNTSQTFTHYEDNLEHSVWLTMMRDRLLHLRKLLSPEGSIWVHLDDVEVHRMRLLMDEVFGAGNFIAQIAWEKVAGRDNRSIMSKTCDFVMVYARSKSTFKDVRNLLVRNDTATVAAYTNPDNDPRGPWTSGDFTAQYNPLENERLDQIYRLLTPAGRELNPPPGRCWLYTAPRYEELLADNRVWFGVDGNNIPRLKRFLSEVQDGLVPKTLWPYNEVGTNDSAKKETQALIPSQNPFDTPKPERLLERVIHIATNPGDIVLDVFAGSGTTAAVAQKMGRRWVTCELLEDTIDRFTRPRLEKVVRGEDPGGITQVAGQREAAADVVLPEGMTAEDAQRFTSLLNKVIKDNPGGLKADPAVKHLKDLTKTVKTQDALTWRGGGGFTTAHLAPPAFDYDPELGMVLLTEHATGDALIRSVAANLGFRLTPEHPSFDGVRGSMRLAVVEGTITTEAALDLASHLGEDEGLTIAALGREDGVAAALRRQARAVRVLHVPDDLFRHLAPDPEPAPEPAPEPEPQPQPMEVAP